MISPQPCPFAGISTTSFQRPNAVRDSGTVDTLVKRLAEHTISRHNMPSWRKNCFGMRFSITTHLNTFCMFGSDLRFGIRSQTSKADHYSETVSHRQLKSDAHRRRPPYAGTSSPTETLMIASRSPAICKVCVNRPTKGVSAGGCPVGTFIAQSRIP